jgi:hypothetical protein
MDIKLSKWSKFFSFILAFLILFYLINNIGLSTFWSVLRTIPIEFFIITILIYSLSWYTRTLRTKFLIPHDVNLSNLSLFKILIAGYALNILLPAKIGDLASIGFLNLNGLAIDRSVVVILQSRIMDAFGLLSTAIIPLMLFSYMIPAWINSILIIGIFIFVTPHLIILLDKKMNFHLIFNKILIIKSTAIITKIVQQAQKCYITYYQVVRSKKQFALIAISSIITWTLEGLTFYVLAVSLTPNITVVISILAISIANLGKIVPATPGSIGIFETILSGTLIIFGIPPSIAITIAIIDHLIKNVYIIIIGVPYASSFGFHLYENIKSNS